jgi:hypothetical protein
VPSAELEIASSVQYLCGASQCHGRILAGLDLHVLQNGLGAAGQVKMSISSIFFLPFTRRCRRAGRAEERDFNPPPV